MKIAERFVVSNLRKAWDGAPPPLSFPALAESLPLSGLWAIFRTRFALHIRI